MDVYAFVSKCLCMCMFPRMRAKRIGRQVLKSFCWNYEKTARSCYDFLKANRKSYEDGIEFVKISELRWEMKQ